MPSASRKVESPDSFEMPAPVSTTMEPLRSVMISVAPLAGPGARHDNPDGADANRRLALVKVLFVCLGNICRSPMAEGVFRKLLEREGLAHRVEVDSAGTGDWHRGAPPDPRAREAAGRRGVDISGQRARQAKRGDFERFDYVLAMDRDNHADLGGIAPPGREDRLRLFLDFAPGLEARDVPDPYYGGPAGFETVLDMIEAAAEGLLAHIKKNHL
jgi:protein-tyrosine phosphatase